MMDSQLLRHGKITYRELWPSQEVWYLLAILFSGAGVIIATIESLPAALGWLSLFVGCLCFGIGVLLDSVLNEAA